MRPHEKTALNRERQSLAHQIETWLEPVMILLGFVWVALLVLELTRGLSPALQDFTRLIWVVFGAEFCLRLFVAPSKWGFLKANLLTLLSLALPAVRVLRFARVFRAAKGVRLIRLVASLNRGMNALSSSMGRRGLPYVIALTLLITVAGAAGMYAFELHPGGQGINDFGTALWWTAMIMTTMGSDYWPRTPEGRLLCLGLAIYAFAVFGYITAALASFFIARDAGSHKTEIAGSADIERLRREIHALRAELHENGR